MDEAAFLEARRSETSPDTRGRTPTDWTGSSRPVNSSHSVTVVRDGRGRRDLRELRGAAARLDTRTAGDRSAPWRRRGAVSTTAVSKGFEAGGKACSWHAECARTCGLATIRQIAEKTRHPKAAERASSRGPRDARPKGRDGPSARTGECAHGGDSPHNRDMCIRRTVDPPSVTTAVRPRCRRAPGRARRWFATTGSGPSAWRRFSAKPCSSRSICSSRIRTCAASSACSSSASSTRSGPTPAACGWSTRRPRPAICGWRTSAARRSRPTARAGRRSICRARAWRGIWWRARTRRMTMVEYRRRRRAAAGAGPRLQPRRPAWRRCSSRRCVCDRDDGLDRVVERPRTGLRVPLARRRCSMPRRARRRSRCTTAGSSIRACSRPGVRPCSRSATAIARDIHDTLAQGFGAILMQLQAAQRSGSASGGLAPAVARSLETAVDLARTHLVEARRSVAALRPQSDEREDVAAALRRMVDLAQRTNDVPDRSRDRRAAGVRCGRRAGDHRHRPGGPDQRRPSRAARAASACSAGAVRGVGFRLSVADDGRGIARDRASSRLRHDQHARARRADRRVARRS